QSTSSATFNWGSYNVKAGQSVVYSVPGSTSISMNYIGGTTPSTIDGKVASNGILYFMNPNGLIFGSGSTVSASGVMAFGSAAPWGTPTGAVTNAGVLTATNNGTVALVGSSVTNSGTITAPGGEVLLAAGSTVTPLSTTGVSSLSVATTGGGQVDDSGVLSAETVGGKTGTILLQSGMGSGTTTLESTAVLDASAPNGGNGGSIAVNGHTVVLDETAPLNVSAPYGTTGTITIDPTVTDVGTASALETIDSSQTSYLNNSSVCIVLTANIDLASGSTPYNWVPLGTSSTSAFTGTFNGNGHTVSGYTIGTSTRNCSANDVGFIGYLGATGVVKSLGVGGTVYASGNCVGGVVGYNNGGTVEYSYNTGAVTGTLSTSIVGGVVGQNTGIVETSYNQGPVSGSVSFMGGVVGQSTGTVEYSYNTGAVTGNLINSFVGGVVGNNTGIVETSYNQGPVVNSPSCAGGVVGQNTGTVETSYNTGSVFSNLFAGGVVGENKGTVEYTYNTGMICAGPIAASGGIVGINFGTVESSWNQGIIYGLTAGGIVGINYRTGTVKNNYYEHDLTSSAIGCNYGTYTNNGPICSPGLWCAPSCFPNLGTFNSWGAGAFTASATTAPWFVGRVSGPIFPSPILVADLSTATVTGSGTSVYSGSTVTAAYTATYTMGGTSLSPNVTVTTSVGPNTGRYPNTPVFTISSAPTTQTGVDSVTVVSGTWTITQAPLTAATTGSKTYDGTNSLSLSGTNTTFTGVGGQTAKLNAGLTGTLSTANVGTSLGGTLTVTGSDLTGAGGFNALNYTLPTTFTGGTITPAPLTATANAASMTYGGTVPTLSGTVTGFVNGQTLAGDSGTANWSTYATSTSNAGEYAIAGNVTLGSPYSGDYTITYASGNNTALTINKAILTATANPASMTYGGTVPSVSGTVTGFVNGQTLAGDSGTANWSTSATSTSNAGQYAIAGNVTLGSPYSGDYTITNVSGNSTALTIGRADLTATATPASMTYGGTVPSVSGTVTGFVNGQTLASDGGLWSTTATSSSSDGSYGISLSLASPYSGDYTIINAFGNATAFTIAGGITGKQIVPV
ncbi:MAG: beta strand repeat-containing protein, partial [Leptospirales bacterium]